MVLIGAEVVAADAAATTVQASEEVVLTADEQALAAKWDLFVMANAKSSDLRLRIIFSSALEKRDGDGIYSQETNPLESLVEQARGSTDPLALAMLFDRCVTGQSKAPRCDALDLARRWTVADSQNQLAWVNLAGELDRRGDHDASRATFLRAAQASMWHDHDGDVVRVMARALPRTLTSRERFLGLQAVFGMAAARAMSMSIPHHYMRAACRDPSTRDACAHILETMFRDADSGLWLSVSWRFAAAAGFPDEVVHARKQRYEAMYWALTNFPFPEYAELGDPTMFAKAVDEIDQRINLGEIEWARRLLQRSRVSEADAAARYVATLPSRRPQ